MSKLELQTSVIGITLSCADQTVQTSVVRYGIIVSNAVDWLRIKQLIEDSAMPEPEKEIVTVLTASETEPSEAEQGDFYIDLSEHLLYQYDGEAWEVAEVGKDVIYITADTSHIYRYDGNQFVDVTGQKVDDTIYVSSIEGNALDQYTEKGLYTVCVGRAGLPSTYYTMVVNTSKRQARPRLIMLYSQLLYNHDGYLRRSKSGTSAWSDWTEFVYVSKDQLDALWKYAKKNRKLAKAAL